MKIRPLAHLLLTFFVPALMLGAPKSTGMIERLLMTSGMVQGSFDDSRRTIPAISRCP